MQAIETVYKGYRFRSRLEARWAVFFDALGIEWEYEPEGYILKGGLCYLPDFWLPQVDLFAEVKPVELTEDELEKVNLLAIESGFGVLKLVGTPENKPYLAVHPTRSGVEDCAYCLTMYHNYPVEESRFYCMPGDYGKGGDAYWPDTEFAAEKARSARFEYGEEGASR